MRSPPGQHAAPRRAFQKCQSGSSASSSKLRPVQSQAVEHYEITRYGTLIAWAKQLGRSDCASVLAETLEEEKATDEKLTQMAESEANAKAERMAEPA